MGAEKLICHYNHSVTRSTMFYRKSMILTTIHGFTRFCTFPTSSWEFSPSTSFLQVFHMIPRKILKFPGIPHFAGDHCISMKIINFMEFSNFLQIHGHYRSPWNSCIFSLDLTNFCALSEKSISSCKIVAREKYSRCDFVRCRKINHAREVGFYIFDTSEI